MLKYSVKKLLSYFRTMIIPQYKLIHLKFQSFLCWIFFIIKYNKYTSLSAQLMPCLKCEYLWNKIPSYPRIGCMYYSVLQISSSGNIPFKKWKNRSWCDEYSYMRYTFFLGALCSLSFSLNKKIFRDQEKVVNFMLNELWLELTKHLT